MTGIKALTIAVGLLALTMFLSAFSNSNQHLGVGLPIWRLSPDA